MGFTANCYTKHTKRRTQSISFDKKPYCLHTTSIKRPSPCHPSLKQFLFIKQSNTLSQFPLLQEKLFRPRKIARGMCRSSCYARAEFNYLIVIIFIENTCFESAKMFKFISVSACPDHNVNDFCFYVYFFNCPEMKSYQKNDVHLLRLVIHSFFCSFLTN